MMSSALPYSLFCAFANPSAETMRHQLHAITDPKNGDAELENLKVGNRSAVIIDAGRTSERIIPFGLKSLIFSMEALKGNISE